MQTVSTGKFVGHATVGKNARDGIGVPVKPNGAPYTGGGGMADVVGTWR